MRFQVSILIMLTFSVSASCETARLTNIRPGMSRTDVAIELGKPAAVKIAGEAILWIYPESESKVCMIKFIDQKVASEPMKCDNSEAIRKLASENSQDSNPTLSHKLSHTLKTMNSEKEYLGRVKRYCGVPPIPSPGCKVSTRCINGGWQEVCTPTR